MRVVYIFCCDDLSKINKNITGGGSLAKAATKSLLAKNQPGIEPATSHIPGLRTNHFAILAVHKSSGDNFCYLNSTNFLLANITAILRLLQVPRYLSTRVLVLTE